MGLYLDIAKKVTVGNTQGSGYADREFDRFFAVAVPTPNGLGLFDPSESADMPSGISGEQWGAFVEYCGNLGKAVRA